MGCSSSRAGGGLSEEARVVMIGPSQSGKTTLLYMLKCNELVITVPTVGANVEFIRAARGFNFLLVDLGGGPQSSPSWGEFYPKSDAVVFVVDCASREQLGAAKETLFTALSDKRLRGVPLLVLANKADLGGTLTPDQIQKELHLGAIIDRAWSVHPVSAVHGKGLDAAVEDLARLIRQTRENRDSLNRDKDVTQAVV